MNDSKETERPVLRLIKIALQMGGMAAIVVMSHLLASFVTNFSWIGLLEFLAIGAGAFLLGFMAIIVIGIVMYVRSKVARRKLSRNGWGVKQVILRMSAFVLSRGIVSGLGSPVLGRG